MMKKVVLCLFLSIILFQPLAANSFNMDTPHKILNVVFRGNTAYAEFGISGEKVTSIIDKPEDFTNPDTKEIYFSESDETGARLTRMFYIYWKVYVSIPLTLTVKGTKVGPFAFEDKIGVLGPFFDASGKPLEVNIPLNYSLPITTPQAGSVPVKLRISADELGKHSISGKVTGRLDLTFKVSTI